MIPLGPSKSFKSVPKRKRTEEAPMRRTESPVCRLGAPDRLRPKAEAPAPRLRGPITGYKGKPASPSLIMVLVAAPSRCLFTLNLVAKVLNS